MAKGATQRQRGRWRLGKRTRAILATAILSGVLLAILGVAGAVYHLSQGLPSAAALTQYRPSQTTEIYSSDGVLLARLFEENREVAPLADIPRTLRDATIAIEDHRFFEHRGVDWRGATRAMSANLRSRGYAQGGSTLTQQLARNVYLSADKNITRKTKEILLAIRMERAFHKARILEMYLNQVYYGERSFGVEAASHRYFGKPAKGLTLPEAALLAGIPQRPAAYDPYKHPKAARERRDLVLRRMAELGYITDKEAKAAMALPVRLAYKEPPHLTARRAPYFVDEVVRQLEERYGAETVFRGGLRVQTTLNTRAQAAAENAVRQGMAARFGRNSRTEAALVSLDPTNGYVRAMVGGRDYGRSVYNRAVQARRQPGSAFKPFVYAAAIGAGYKPTDRIVDGPVRFEGFDWRPHNLGGRWHGSVTLTQALSQSINIPAVKLMQEVGADNVVRMARSAGIESRLNPVPALALGSSEVGVLELASAYSVFAAGGMRTPPLCIVEVRQADGRLMERRYPEPAMVLDETVARRMDYMLRQVVRAGTGRAAAGIPNARGKTGTTNELKDAWFVGYTPSLVTAVWVGNDTPTRIAGLSGGSACAPIWVAYMRQALAILPNRAPATAPTPEAAPDFRVAETEGADPAPQITEIAPRGKVADAGVGMPEALNEGDVRRRVCLLSGLLATANCPEAVTEYYAPGAEPVDRCDMHARPEPPDAAPGEAMTLCQETGGLAGPYCRNTVTVLREKGEPRPKPCNRHTARRRPAD